MNSVKVKILVLLLIVSVPFSCSKPSANNNMTTCSISYTISKALSKDQQVQYLAGVSGTGGAISSVSYLDSAGTTTVQNPLLPLTVNVNLKKGAFASISAKGTANLGGQIIIYIKADSVQNGYACGN
jgi:hypothetical protein